MCNPTHARYNQATIRTAAEFLEVNLKYKFLELNVIKINAISLIFSSFYSIYICTQF